MHRNGVVLTGVAVALAILAGVLWLLQGEGAQPAPARIVSVPGAGAPVEPGTLPVPAGPGAALTEVEALVAAPGDAPPPAATPAGPAELRCRVLALADGAPLADVAVTVFHHFDPYREGPGSSSARTDADGVASFPFTDTTRVWQVTALPGPGHALCEVQPALTLAPGQVETLELRAERGATLRGTVVDEGGRPVPQASVSAWCTFRWSIESSSSSPVPEAHITLLADGAGRFEVAGLGPVFVLMADAPGLASLRGYAGELAQDALLEGVELVVGPAAEFRGRVLDADRQPVAFASVEALNAYPEMGDGVPASCPPLKAQVYTDGDGRFVLGPLAVRHWRLSATHELHGQWTGSGAPDGKELEIVFPRGCRVRGVVRDAAGAPLAGATLQLQGASKDDGHGPAGWATMDTGEDGLFQFDALVPTDNAMLGASAAGHAIHIVEKLVVKDGEGEFLDLRLEPERALGGLVVDEAGAPLAGAGIEIRGDRILPVKYSPAPTWESWFRAQTGVTGPDGRFRIGRLYDGEFLLTVSDPRHAGLHRTLTVRSGTEDLTIKLDADELRGAVVTGIVRDALSGAPVQEFSLSFSPADEALRSASAFKPAGQFHDAEGRYALQGFEPGTYTSFVMAKGYVWGRVGPWTLVAGENVLDFELSPERTLRLRAVDETGAPVSNAFVSFEGEGGQPIQLMDQPKGDGSLGMTDRKGEVSALRLPAERIVVLLKLSRVPGFSESALVHRFPFDLRVQPVGVQEVVIPRSGQRLLAVRFLQDTSGAAGEFSGQDLADRTLFPRIAAAIGKDALVPPTVAIQATLHAADDAVLASASCTPAAAGLYAVQSFVSRGDAGRATILLALPQEACRLEVSAGGGAPQVLAIPAGTEHVRRLVIVPPP